MHDVLAHDVRHKEEEAKALPSVEEWIKQGGVVEVLGDTPPRPEATMIAWAKL